MQITTQWLQEWFGRFNQHYFDGMLPVPILKVGRSRTRLGSYSYKRIRKGFKLVKKDETIILSNYYDLSELEFKSVLLHEMIHYVIDYTRLKDTSAHGVIFRGMMARLNRDGWDIRISHRGANITPRAGNVNRGKAHKAHLIMAIEKTNGIFMIAAVSRSAYSRIERVLHLAPDIRAHHWMISNDSWFDNKPTVRSPRAIPVSEETYRKLTQEAVPLFEDELH
ncbi:MAG: SprT-like domain-containing protein [Prevotella sp.]|jgi:hypothetical protein